MQCMLASANFREDLSFHLTEDKKLLGMEYRTFTPLDKCSNNQNVVALQICAYRLAQSEYL